MRKFEKVTLENVSRYCGESYESLKDVRGKDRVRHCRFLTSFHKAWKVTMVGIECNGAAFLKSFQEGPHQKFFFQGFFHNSASKMANTITVEVVNYPMLLLANS